MLMQAMAASIALCVAGVGHADITHIDFTGRGTVLQGDDLGGTYVFNGAIDLGTTIVPDNATGTYTLGDYPDTTYRVDVNRAGKYRRVSFFNGSDDSGTPQAITLDNGVLTGIDFPNALADVYVRSVTGSSFLFINYDEFGGDSYFAEGTFALGGGAVPEPATWILCVAGLGVVGMAVRRRSRLLPA